MKRTCSQCGAEFEGRATAVACSPPCRAAHKRAYSAAYQKARRRTDEAYRVMKNQSGIRCARRRWLADPGFRERQRAHNRASAKATRDARKHDPAFLAAEAAAGRAKYRRQKEVKAVADLARVAAELETLA